MISDELLRDANSWLAIDPDPATRAELTALLEADDEAALLDCFAGRLTFGTAGLRAAMGPGPNRMNRVAVSQAAAGFGRWLNANGSGGGKILIGYDARYNSADFARDSAEILSGLGFETILTETFVPTPVVAFGIRHLGCVAAIVVTASHNPPADNGYKVYLGDGSQIIPPADAEIAACIDEVADGPFVFDRGEYATIGDELREAYLSRATAIFGERDPRDVSWIYTPMHGVGGDWMLSAAQTIGLPAPRIVTEQFQPDPDFPTVSFPNPEEPGALDLALSMADDETDVIIANDPDADRCAIAAKVAGVWRRLSGDELGWLLADDTVQRGHPGTLACSFVSSTLLEDLARANDYAFARTLTGFKWIGRVPDLAFGYEEAIGYCCDSEYVSDKDGLTAALVVLRLIAELNAQGETLSDRLDEIAREYGACITSQTSMRVTELSQIAHLMQTLRSNPPQELAGRRVEFTDRLAAEELRSDTLELRGNGFQVIIRPSGTEPKLKCYLEVKLSASRTNELGLEEAREQLRGELDALENTVNLLFGNS